VANICVAPLATAIRRIVSPRWRPIGYLTELTQRRCGSRVLRGPFRGLQYIGESVGSAYIPKLLGIYERELNAVIERACSLGFHLILDIGAAEGYYAVGMAIRNPQAQVVGFEMELNGQTALSQMAVLNGAASRVAIRGKCEPADLTALLRNARDDRTLVICDVEGYEDNLLNPALVPALRHVWTLVELHEFVRPGITQLLVARFESSHAIEQIWQDTRSRAEYPFRTLGTTLLPSSYLDWAVSEWRPETMSWLWMKPRHLS